MISAVSEEGRIEGGSAFGTAGLELGAEVVAAGEADGDGAGEELLAKGTMDAAVEEPEEAQIDPNAHGATDNPRGNDEQAVVNAIGNSKEFSKQREGRSEHDVGQGHDQQGQQDREGDIAAAEGLESSVPESGTLGGVIDEGQFREDSEPARVVGDGAFHGVSFGGRIRGGAGEDKWMGQEARRHAGEQR